MPFDVDRRGKVVAALNALDALVLQRPNEHGRKVALVVALTQLAVLLLVASP